MSILLKHPEANHSQSIEGYQLDQQPIPDSSYTQLDQIIADIRTSTEKQTDSSHNILKKIRNLFFELHETIGTKDPSKVSQLIELILNFPTENLDRKQNHDLKNLLTIAVHHFELMYHDPAKINAHIQGFLAAIKLIEILINPTSESNLQDLIEKSLLESYRSLITANKIKVTCQNLSLLKKTNCLPNLVSAIHNIILNAIEELSVANPDQAHIRISVSGTLEYIYLEISDNGRGMSPETQSQIFQKFSTKNRGSGAGMYQMDSKLADENIFIQFSSDNSGTKFTLIIPRVINLSPK